MRTHVAFLVLFVAISAAAADDRFNQVDELFKRWDRSDSPGVALGIVHRGELIYAKGYGMANLELEVPLDEDSVFYMASESKQFTAACLALLAQDGKLSFEDDIRKYLPELPEYEQTITIGHLVTHTSGIKDYLSLRAAANKPYGDAFTEHQILKLIASQPELNHAPGEDYLYSNSGYFLMGQIVHRVTGKSLREFAQERIFGPLEMTRTLFHDDHRMVIPGRVTGYARDGDRFVRNAMLSFDAVGSGGLRSCVSDLLKWDQNFYSGKVGGQPLIEAMRTRGRLNDGTTLSYACGIQVDRYKGLKVDRHGGSMSGFRTHILRFPEHEFTVICLGNLGELQPGTLVQQVADLFLSEPISQSLQDYVGVYRNEALDADYTVRADGVDLMIDSGDGDFSKLEPRGQEGFAIGGLSLQFNRDTDGRVESASIEMPRAKSIVFDRLE